MIEIDELVRIATRFIEESHLEHAGLHVARHAFQEWLREHAPQDILEWFLENAEVAWAAVCAAVSSVPEVLGDLVDQLPDIIGGLLGG